MERIFAAVIDGLIVNTFVGDDSFVALVRADYNDVFEVTNLEPQPGIGWTVSSDGYRPPQPFPSWAWDGTTWVAPIPLPNEEAIWAWDENLGNWVIFKAPDFTAG